MSVPTEALFLLGAGLVAPSLAVMITTPSSSLPLWAANVTVTAWAFGTLILLVAVISLVA